MAQRVEVGFACNNRCVFCAQGELGDAPAAEGWRAALEAALAALVPGQVVVFAGGEPTLHDALPAWLAQAAARGAARVLVQTNARRLAYLGYARELARATSLLGLEVSLQGSNAPMHDYHTATPGSFGETLRGLRHARALGVPFALATVVTRSNFRHLAEMVRLARHLGARSLYLAHAAPFGRARAAAERVVPNRGVVAPYLAAAHGEAERERLTLFDEAHPPGPDDLHAGIGVVEPPRTPEPKAEERAPKRLPLHKPAPGLGEVRTPARRSGDELRAIFPSLFGDAEAEAKKPAPPKG